MTEQFYKIVFYEKVFLIHFTLICLLTFYMSFLSKFVAQKKIRNEVKKKVFILFE